MKKCFCDICGKEINNNKNYSLKINKKEYFFNNNIVLKDKDDEKLNLDYEDVCPECIAKFYACVTMMKEVNWCPDFHEKLESDSIYERDKAGYIISDIEELTGFHF